MYIFRRQKNRKHKLSVFVMKIYLPICMTHHFLHVAIWEFIMNVEISRICPNQETVLGNRGCLKVLTITYKSRLTQLTPKQLYKKKGWYFSIYGRNGIMPWFFFKFSLRPFEVVEVEWQSILNFEVATSKFCNCSWKFGSSPRR